ncbi:hypothetical protein TIFTF001_010864 [Ficus carica]|uniref:Uncharacterized protein n=1 Tax=Ficus carica TaxID=3494 RepID=A0AA87ZSF9_FICCA|nr:hypothetical protein TIFTF001_010864 [Ficus carica]
MERNNKKLKGVDIIKEALKIFSENINFTIFTSLISLPLFCFALYYESFLQNFLQQTSDFFRSKENDDGFSSYNHYYYFNSNWFLPLDIVRKLNQDLFHDLAQLGFLYLVPLHLLELVTVFLTVDLASKIYREDMSLTFKDMFGIKIGRERLRGILVTYGYVVFLSTCTLLGFIWLLITYSDILRYFSAESDLYIFPSISSMALDACSHLVYGANLLLLIGIYLVWSAIWNLGLVISVLKAGTYGAKAIGSSAYLSLRNARNGVILMLVFSIWGVGLRIPCLVFACYKSWGWMVARTSLFCLGNALKWVSFVVYFEDCVWRIFGKKVDVVEGQNL